MFKNYIKTAWRNLKRNPGSSTINIGGLAIGMAVAMQIGLWIYDELSFDKSFDNYDHIARVIQNVTNNGEVQTWSNVPFPLAEELRKNYGSDFRHVVMAANWGDHVLSYNDKKLTHPGAYLEQGAPDMLSLDMLQGSRQSFTDPSNILLSASAAKAYFGDGPVLDKVMKIDNEYTVKVGGVYRDFPRNSSFTNLQFIATWDLYYANSPWMKTMEDPWRPNSCALFVQLIDHADPAKVSERIRDAKLKKVTPQLAQKKPALFLQPMRQWHLYAEFKNGKNTGGAIQYVWLFGIIGVFVLLLACINFMNLSTARSEKRAREVGIRKTLGSLRKQLILQFFSESLLTAGCAFIISVLLVQCTLPFFNLLADKKMAIPWTNRFFWLMAIGFTILTGLVAGSYPSLYLSSFMPVKVLKGTARAGRYAAIPRKILVVVQFTVSVTLITGTVIIYQQILFAKDRPTGYNRNNLVSVPTMNPAIHTHFDAVSKELLQSGAIASVAESQSPTTAIWNSTSGISWPGKDPNLSTDFGVVAVGFNYGKTINWKMKEGRDFSRDFSTDSTAVILNEAAVHYMGLKKPLGTVITWWGHNCPVIGVIQNMIIESPYNEPRPAVYRVSDEPGSMALIRVSSSVSYQKALAVIEPVFKKFNPDQPFQYRFVDDEYAQKFGNEERIGKLAGFFSALAIAISCLGLFGLTAFVAEQRKKEIGVRKILGASVLNVWKLLSAGFVTLVLISFLIAIPISYYCMYTWLQHFEYHTALSWWIFALAGMGALLVTLITVSFQAIRAAVSNPVKSLRTE